MYVCVIDLDNLETKITIYIEFGKFRWFFARITIWLIVCLCSRLTLDLVCLVFSFFSFCLFVFVLLDYDL